MLHVDSDMNSGPNIILFIRFHVRHSPVSNHKVGTVLHDISRGLLGLLQLALDEVLGVVPTRVVHNNPKQRVLVRDN